jgi:hypothetical protein
MGAIVLWSVVGDAVAGWMVVTLAVCTAKARRALL